MVADSGTEAWRKARNTGIGASEAAAVCGLEGAYQTPLSIWQRKTGQIGEEQETRQMRRGTLLERYLVEEFQSETGLKVARYPCPMYRHPDPELWFMLATPDGELENGDLLECKTVTFRKRDELGEEGFDVMPPAWNLQAQQQMAVTGASKVHVWAMSGFESGWHGVVERNDRLIDLLIAREREFWSMVEARTPPAPDWSHPRTVEAVRQMFPVDVGKVQLLSDALVELCKDWKIAGEMEREWKKKKESLGAQIAYAMKDSQIGYHPDWDRELVRSQVGPVKIPAYEKAGYIKLYERKRKNEYVPAIEGSDSGRCSEGDDSLEGRADVSGLGAASLTDSRAIYASGTELDHSQPEDR